MKFIDLILPPVITTHPFTKLEMEAKMGHELPYVNTSWRIPEGEAIIKDPLDEEHREEYFEYLRGLIMADNFVEASPKRLPLCWFSLGESILTKKEHKESIKKWLGRCM